LGHGRSRVSREVPVSDCHEHPTLAFVDSILKKQRKAYQVIRNGLDPCDAPLDISAMPEPVLLDCFTINGSLALPLGRPVAVRLGGRSKQLHPPLVADHCTSCSHCCFDSEI